MSEERMIPAEVLEKARDAYEDAASCGSADSEGLEAALQAIDYCGLVEENARLKSTICDMQRWIDHHSERADRAEAALATQEQQP